MAEVGTGTETETGEEHELETRTERLGKDLRVFRRFFRLACFFLCVGCVRVVGGNGTIAGPCCNDGVNGKSKMLGTFETVIGFVVATR
jgi:hypothetical protein